MQRILKVMEIKPRNAGIIKENKLIEERMTN